MAEDKQPSKGRVRRWLDRRRESQRRGADIQQRAKSARRADAENLRRRGGGDGGGPFGGGM